MHDPLNSTPERTGDAVNPGFVFEENAARGKMTLGDHNKALLQTSDFWPTAIIVTILVVLAITITVLAYAMIMFSFFYSPGC